MASSIVQQHRRPASIAPTPRRKPDQQQILRSYEHQCTIGGKRGAYRRTGDLYGISDETVRRYVLAFDTAAAAVDELPDDLRYIPPPHAYPAPIAPYVPAQAATEDATAQPHDAAAACGDVTSRDDGESVTEPGASSLATPEPPHATMPQRHVDELASEPQPMPRTPQPRYITTRPDPPRSHLLAWSTVDLSIMASPIGGMVLAAIVILLVYFN